MEFDIAHSFQPSAFRKISHGFARIITALSGAHTRAKDSAQSESKIFGSLIADDTARSELRLWQKLKADS
jgi:hypothetical protein